MRIAYFDCHFGAAGDMLNAALLAAGLDEIRWRTELKKIALPAKAFDVRISSVMRCNLACKKLDVLDDSGSKLDELYQMSLSPIDEDARPAKRSHHAAAANDHAHGQNEHDHEHDHAHEHGHDHSHDHSHNYPQAQAENLDAAQAQQHRQPGKSNRPNLSVANRDQLERPRTRRLSSEFDNCRDVDWSDAEDSPPAELAGDTSSSSNKPQSPALGKQESHVHHTRRLTDILRLIERSLISSGAKDLASRIFMRLADAESKVHGVPPEAVHFHEVGAVDAIVDIVGFAIGYDLLSIERSYCSAVAIGSGSVRTEHGIFPAPGPATMYLLSDVGAALAQSNIPFECLTPTGAAILCEITSGWGQQPPMSKVLSTGYGAGTKDTSDHPNACRVIIGEAQLDGAEAKIPSATPSSQAKIVSPTPTIRATGPDSEQKPSDESAAKGKSQPRFQQETIAIVEANIDDMNPQMLAFAVERFYELGALDVTVAPCTMKKGRSGNVITILCALEMELPMQELVLLETTSIGVRSYHAQRLVAQRRWQTVTLKSGSAIRIKLAFDNDGQVMNAQPEYEDCAECARRTGIPLKDVMIEALQQYYLHTDRG